MTPWASNWFITGSTDGQLTFGSEIRAILAAEDSKPEVDPIGTQSVSSLSLYAFSFNNFQGHSKAGAGNDANSRERTNAAKNAGTTTRQCHSQVRKEEKEAAEELLELYRGAVKRHLLSDVPVGILLSGGLDSGLLLALMNEQGGPGQPTR